MVQKGLLAVGDPVVAGAAFGKVKALINDQGKPIKSAGPSTPVQILGFSEPPFAGDEMRVAHDLAHARSLAEARAQRARLIGHQPVASTSGARLEDLFEQIQRGETATLNIVLKADVQGSLEACTESLRKLERDDVKLVIVHRGVGGITENDVQLAKASNATIIGFNVRPDKRSRDLAETEGVQIRTYEIIYKLIEEIEAAMLGLLSPVYEEIVTGEAEVREVFRVPSIGAIAGCFVRDGVITRGSKVRFLREGTIIWKGSITSLRRFKDDAREVASGFECGIGLSDYQDLKAGDIIETFEEREIPQNGLTHGPFIWITPSVPTLGARQSDSSRGDLGRIDEDLGRRRPHRHRDGDRRRDDAGPAPGDGLLRLPDARDEARARRAPGADPVGRQRADEIQAHAEALVHGRSGRGQRRGRGGDHPSPKP